jgi:hypothetical protein
VIHSPRNIVTLFLLAAVALTLGLGAGVAPASAKGKPPCWKTLINDWYDGRIDRIYEIHCYRDALKHLPADVDTYSSARDDIKQALQRRIQGKNGGDTTTPATTTTGGTGGGSNGGGNSGGGSSAGGPVGKAFDLGKPTKADAVPVPLLVLAGVAFVLMIGGAAGFLTRRTRLRRLPTASAASLPGGQGTPPQNQP